VESHSYPIYDSSKHIFTQFTICQIKIQQTNFNDSLNDTILPKSEFSKSVCFGPECEFEDDKPGRLG